MRYLLLLLFTFAILFAKQELEFTDQEKLYIKENPIIKAGSGNDWAPFNFIDRYGQFNGMTRDYIELLERKTGLKIEITAGHWPAIYQGFVNKQFDILPAALYKKEREEHGNYVTAHISLRDFVYVREDDNSIKSFKDLNGKRLARIKGYAVLDPYLPHLKDITIIEVDTTLDLIGAVLNGEADAFLEGQATINYILKENMISGLKEILQTISPPTTAHILVEKQNTLLHSILSKAMQSISPQEHKNIYDNWAKFVQGDEEDELFTLEEKNWIQENPIVKVGGELDWEPFDFVNAAGKYDGIAKDMLHILAKNTGLQFKVETGRTWNELLEALKSREIDMLPAIYHAKEREEFALFSDPYLSLPEFLFTRNDAPRYTSIKEFSGKRLALVEGYEIVTWVQERYPEIKIITKPSIMHALQAVIAGEADGYIGDNPSTTQVIKTNFLTDLAINFALAERTPIKVNMAIRSDQVLLHSIIKKSLNNISSSQRNEIISKWFSNNMLQSDDKLYEEVSLEDIIPIKESLLALFLVLLLLFGMFKYLKKHESFSLNTAALIFVGIFLLLSVAMTLITVKNLETLHKREIKNSLQTLLNLTEKSFETWLSSYNQTLKFIASGSDFNELAIELLAHKSNTNQLLKINQKTRLKLAVLQKQFPLMEEYIIASHDTTIIAASNAKLIGTVANVDQLSNAIKEAFKEGSSVMMPLQEKEHNFKHIYLFSTIKDPSKRHATAVIGFGLNPSVLFDIAQEGRIGSSGETYIVNKLMQLSSQSRFENELKSSGLIHADQSSFLNVKIQFNNQATKALQDALKAKDGYDTQGYRDYRGRVVFGAWRFNETLGAAIISEINKEEALSSHLKLRGTILIIMFSIVAFTIILLAFILWFANRNKKQLEAKNKELKEFSDSLELKVEERTQSLAEQKEFVQTLLDSQEQLIITTNGETLLSANETFFDFFAVDTLEEFMQTYGAKCICDTFNTKAPDGYLQIQMGEDGRESWIDYVISRSFGETHKVMITIAEHDFIFSVNAAKLPGDDGVKSAVFTNITEMEKAKEQIEEIHNHTRESIEYASLIQNTLIPDTLSFTNFFKEHFSIWEPKDIVGGDIYLFEELRNEDECLLMVIDCTGHGVPGAFVTMLVKAIERQVTSKIKHSDEVVSPAKILSIFNKSMKHLLKQESIDSVSNAGFDGGIIYYNKKEKILKFAGAETPLFYIENKKLKMIKGDRHSIGYKKSDSNYEFTEHTLNIEDGMSFYLSTDGYLDQNGGEKQFPFGKKNFKKIIEEQKEKPFEEQKQAFIEKLKEYQGSQERNDDVTLVAFKI